MSWIASLTATWLNPQVRQSATVSATASASSGRDCRDGGTKFSSIPTHLRRLRRAPSPAPAGNASRHRERQCEQVPAISITGRLGQRPTPVAPGPLAKTRRDDDYVSRLLYCTATRSVAQCAPFSEKPE